MSATTPRRTSWLLTAPEIRDVHAPRWFHRLPVWLSTAGVLAVLVAISAVLRTRYIGGQLWGDEATAVGIAHHPLGTIPGLLRHDGSAPLYYLLLHVWMSAAGTSESGTHALSLLLSLLTIPVAMWAGWSRFGRRAGMAAAVLFAFSPFLTKYAQETQAYALLALIGLVATASFLPAFVLGRRRHLVIFAIALALALYTSFWAIFFWVGAGVALVVINRTGDRRPRLWRDAVLAYAAALVLYLPWIPNLIYQIGHTTSPWGYDDQSGLGFPSSLLGSDRVTVALLITGVLAFVPLAAAARRRTPQARMIWALLTIALAAAVAARVFSWLLSPVWETRYLTTILAALLLAGAVGCARSGILGLIAIVLTLAFVANSASFSPQYKSDMRDVAGELAPSLRAGDLVLVGEPEQTPLAWYYLPAGLRWATTLGPVADPSYMNWVNAYTRLADANPRSGEARIVAQLRPGQRLLYIRPLTEGATGWSQSWSSLVRRRAAQWGALLASDPRLRAIGGAQAPHNYRSACCVADSAVTYVTRG